MFIRLTITVISDVVKDLGHEAKARTKDLDHEAKAKAKDLGHEAKKLRTGPRTWVTRPRPRPRTWVRGQGQGRGLGSRDQEFGSLYQRART